LSKLPAALPAALQQREALGVLGVEVWSRAREAMQGHLGDDRERSSIRRSGLGELVPQVKISSEAIGDGAGWEVKCCRLGLSEGPAGDGAGRALNAVIVAVLPSGLAVVSADEDVVVRCGLDADMAVLPDWGVHDRVDFVDRGVAELAFLTLLGNKCSLPAAMRAARPDPEVLELMEASRAGGAGGNELHREQQLRVPVLVEVLGR